MQKVKESDRCRGLCALQGEKKGTVRRKKERGEEDAASRVPSERLRRRGRS